MKTSTTKTAKTAPATKKATTKSAKPAEALAAAIMSEFLPNFTAPELVVQVLPDENLHAEPVSEISEVALPAVSVETAPEEATTPATEPVATTEVPAVPAAPIVPIPSSVIVAKGTKTMGIYQLTSRQNSIENFKLVGSSTQIEICTRDYMNWCKKAKAPKSMQAEYNRVAGLANLKPGECIDPTILFKVEILKTCNTPAELDAAKIEFGLTKVKPAKPTPEQVSGTLAMHKAIADCAKLFAPPTTEERPNQKTSKAAAATLQVAKTYKIDLTRPIGYKKTPAIAAAAPIWQVETPFGKEFTEMQRGSAK